MFRVVQSTEKSSVIFTALDSEDVASGEMLFCGKAEGTVRFHALSSTPITVTHAPNTCSKALYTLVGVYVNLIPVAFEISTSVL